MKDLTKQKTNTLAQQFGVSSIPNTRSSGSDSPQVDYNNLLNKPASSASPIYGGQIISHAAGTFFPIGWSFTRVGMGIYTITHNLGTTNYAVVVWPTFAGEAFCITGWSAIDANSFGIYINNPDASFGFQDSDLTFILTTQANP